jgi:CBS domain-containing protein
VEGDLGVRPRGGESEGAAVAEARRTTYDRLVPAVREIMASDVLGVGPETSLLDAARRMHERRVGAVVVLDGERLVGILTERDVLRAVATERVECAVAESMTHNPDTIEADENAGYAASIMIHGGFRHLPVVEGEAVVGMISIRDLVRLSVDDEAPRGA